MQNFNNIKKIILETKNFLQDKYKIKEIGIFGSYIRNENKLDSDLDILVDFDEVPGFFKYLELENYLSDKLGVKVDLVLKTALKPLIGQQILKEIVLL